MIKYIIISAALVACTPKEPSTAIELPPLKEEVAAAAQPPAGAPKEPVAPASRESSVNGKTVTVRVPKSASVDCKLPENSAKIECKAPSKEMPKIEKPKQ